MLLRATLDLSTPAPKEHVARCLHVKKNGAQPLNSFKHLQFMETLLYRRSLPCSRAPQICRSCLPSIKTTDLCEPADLFDAVLPFG